MLRLTDQEHARIQRRIAEGSGPAPLPVNPYARMNKTEARYARLLDVELKEGEALSWEFEKVKLKLAEKDFYTPDFFVVRPHLFEFIEIKGGYIREDATEKFKFAREMYPWFRFVMMQYNKGKWSRIR